MVKTALHFAALGCKLFPAFRKNGDHQPLIRWKEESSSDPATLEKWAKDFKYLDSYFCIALKQSNMTVVDVDVKDDKKGLESLQKLQETHGELPPTYTVQTPSGGFHYFYNTFTKVSYSKMFGEGIDSPVMVPLPGTEIKGRGVYRPLNASPVATVPEWFISLSEELAQCSAGADIVDETPETIYSIANFLAATQTVAIEGLNGDNTTVQVALMVRDKGLSKETCLDLMYEHWNVRCSPPWDYDELQKKVFSAYNSAQNEIGCRSVINDFPEIEIGMPQPIILADGTEEKEFYTPDDFNPPPPPREWLVKGWLPKSEVSSLYGAGGSGKSLAAVHLSYSVGSGIPLFGLEVQEKATVLYYACEDKYHELHRRFYNVRRGPDLKNATLDISNIILAPSSRKFRPSTFITEFELGGVRCKKTPFFYKLRQQLLSISGHKLLILDTVTDFFDGEENNRRQVNHFVKIILAELVEECDTTILIIGHPSKNKDAVYSGSTAWLGAVRNMLSFKIPEQKHKSENRELTIEKSNYGRKGDMIELLWDNWSYTKVSDNVIREKQFEDNKQIMYEIIEEHQYRGSLIAESKNAKNSYHKIPMHDAEGHLMDDDLKKELIESLIECGTVALTDAPGRKSYSTLI